MAHIIHSDYKTDWETPQSLFDGLDKNFHFTLDAAASASNAKCRQYIDKETNALAVPWSGRVWLNPPYGKGIDRWVKKCVDEMDNTDLIVALLPCATDTSWFHEWVLPYADIVFIRGRVQFGLPGHKRRGGNPGPNMLAVYPKQQSRSC